MQEAILKRQSVNEIKKMEMELKKANAVISFMADGLLLVDKNLKVIMANEAAAVMLRTAPKNLNGKKLRSVLQLESEGKKVDLDKILTEKVILGHDIMRFGIEKKILCQSKDKESFYINFTASPFWSDDLSGLIIIFRDGTREHDLEESKDNFISITSHQLRTPLTSIRWNAEMLNDELKEISQRKEFAQQIYEGTLRLNETINLILSLSRSEKGRVAEKIELVNLEKLTQITLENLKLLINVKKLAVKARPHPQNASFVFRHRFYW